MSRPVVRTIALALLITVGLCVHLLAKMIVAHGFGIAALIILFASLPFLSRYLD